LKIGIGGSGCAKAACRDYRPALTSGVGSNCDFHSNNNGDAVTDDSDNDIASKCEDRVRELETALKTLTANESDRTDDACRCAGSQRKITTDEIGRHGKRGEKDLSRYDRCVERALTIMLISLKGLSTASSCVRLLAVDVSGAVHPSCPN
jgi:hypothetical protein